ncbi:SgcJ/EcaC family oxidoreductase [Marivirga sp. S37H4]|uniref:SgcJ/EcaC family oxidoreductase n=1 Tax=Marivirga aurantiaca TaxID=2802615 RepID=A0A934X2B0_9BACT|nr:SgcJ/EcaC family oxidoreductase [Marivirga aurantiaca]MBK6267075.1 SgcJ/EcaC family oxidoreductase [Marivirga aurantiaca]
MKKSVTSFLATVSILLLGTTAYAQSKEKVAVEELIHTYFDALNSGDAEKVTSLFTKTGVLLAQGAPTATGSEQVNGTFQYVFDNFSYDLKVSIGEVIVQGKYAIVSSTSTGSFVIKASKENVPADFRETFILQKEKGDWKIASYMYNQPK